MAISRRRASVSMIEVGIKLLGSLILFGVNITVSISIVAQFHPIHKELGFSPVQKTACTQVMP
ncbi:MAG: hypothetical protein WCC63_05630, partial [Candidatus Bathyarchaeia archaeon]